MKQLTRSIVLASALAMAGTAGASTMMDEVSPYVGADFKYMFLRGSGRPWRDSNRDGFAAGTIYAGVRFCENFGIEAGYTFTGNRSRSFTFTNGIYTTTGTVRSRLNNWHIDLMGFICLDPCWELFGALGIGWYTPRASLTVTSITPVNATSLAALATFNGVTGTNNTRAAARVGAGVQYMFSDCVGARGTIRWENTRNIRYSGAVVTTPAVTTVLGGPFTNRPFRDTVSLAIGLFVKF